MDHLEYGLEEPKLTLDANGDVFLAGQVQVAQNPTIASRFGSDGGRVSSIAGPGATTLVQGNTLLGKIKISKMGLLAANADVYGANNTEWEKFVFTANSVTRYTISPYVTQHYLTALDFLRMNQFHAPMQTIYTHGRNMNSYDYSVRKLDPQGNTYLEKRTAILQGNDQIVGIWSRKPAGTDVGDLYDIDVAFNDADLGPQIERIKTSLLPLPSPSSGIQPSVIQTDILILNFCWSDQAYKRWKPILQPLDGKARPIVLTLIGTQKIDYVTRTLGILLNKGVSADKFEAEFRKVIVDTYHFDPASFKFYYDNKYN